MSKNYLIFSSFFILQLVFSQDYDIEILPESCDCRDWYGGCRKNGEKWIDDQIWKYECDSTKKSDSIFVGCQINDEQEIEVGSNITIDGLWQSCSENEQKLEYKIESHCNVNGTKYRVGEEYQINSFQWLCLSTGQWITGCYYSNETNSNILLRIGQHEFNGLIEHICEKRQEYPAIVQYFTQVRKDVDVKHPTNKGFNNNFPSSIQTIIEEEKNIRWLHDSSQYFIKNQEKPLSYVRYLPASRRPLDA